MALYDSTGRPVDTRALQRGQVAGATLSGLRSVWHDSQASGLTPSRLASILARAAENDPYDYLTLAEDMEERELHYAGVLQVRKLALCGLEILVEAPTDKRQDVRLVDETTELTRQPWFPVLLHDMVDAIGKGYSICEIDWDSSESQWAIKSCDWRDPRWFRLDRVDGRTFRLVDEKNQADGMPLTPFKFITHIAKIKTGLPIRGGLARLAAVPFMCKSYALKDWMAFAEVFGMPLRIGRYPQAASAEDQAKLLTAVANLGTDAAAILPETMMVEVLAAPRSSGGEVLFERLGDWLDRQVSKAVLGQTMTTDDGASLSQAQVHNDVRKDFLRSDALQVSATLNRDLVRPFIDLNFGPQKAYPAIKLYIKETTDLVAFSNALVPLIDRGLEVEASVIRDKFGLPEPASGAEVLGSSRRRMKR